MASRTVTFTHKGWFGVCPVYLARLETQSPDVHERHWIFAPLMWLSVAIYSLCFAQVIEQHGPDVELEWPLKVTGQLRKSITLELQEVDEA